MDRGIINPGRTKKSIWTDPAKNIDEEFKNPRTPETTQASEKAGQWLDRQMKKNAPQTTEEYVERVSYHRFRELDTAAERMVSILNSPDNSRINELLHHTDYFLRISYRQCALQFLQNYDKEVRLLENAGQDPEKDIDFRKKLKVSTDKLIGLAAEIINSTGDLEKKMPSKGLEKYLQEKKPATKEEAA